MNAKPSDIEREFRYSVQALAQPAPEQIRLNGQGGCVTCDLFEDYSNWHSVYLNHFREKLKSEQQSAILNVMNALNNVPDADCECFDADMLNRPSWAIVREQAIRALESLGWEIASPPAMIQTSPGIWSMA